MVKDTALELEDHGLLSSRDRELITGLNANKNQKHSHLLKSQHPYAYPLMKLHKLSSEQISAGTTPPMRLIHAQKFGPLYRVEKWLSPYLTDVSRRYCGDEFILDTDDLLKQIQAHNTSTLDIPVEETYLSYLSSASVVTQSRAISISDHPMASYLNTIPVQS